jgi:hypothetical protein
MDLRAARLRGSVTDDQVEGDGGESACYAHLICPECGTVLDGAEHLDDCTWMESNSRIELTHNVNPVPRD